MLRRRAGEGEAQLPVQEHHAAPALLDDRPEALLALPQLALGAFPFGDVADEGGERRLEAAAGGGEGDLDRELLAVRAADHGPKGVHLTLGENAGAERPAERLAGGDAEGLLRLAVPLDDVHRAVDRD